MITACFYHVTPSALSTGYTEMLECIRQVWELQTKELEREELLHMEALVDRMA